MGVEPVGSGPILLLILMLVNLVGEAENNPLTSLVMSVPRPTSLAERRVHLPRVADVVADRIRELIVSGALGDGERLPRLEDLLEEFGVSGPSMREALRMLESEGLITVQRGSIGGAVVHRPDAKTAAYTLALVLRSRGTKLRDVVEAMALLEPVCASLCARRSDRKKTVVRQLRKINATARDLVDGDEVAYNEAMTSFHKTVVKGCGNGTLSLLVGALEVNLLTWSEATAAHGTYPTRAVRLKNLARHGELCDLIEAGDDEEVARVMREHIDRYLPVLGFDSNQLVDAQAIRLRK
jgi:DNA-binding FadR family transcriptional regulator